MRWKRIILWISVALAALITTAVAVLYLAFPKVRPAPVLTAPNDAATVARGEYIVKSVSLCLGCHSGMSEAPGRPLEDDGRLGAGKVMAAWEGLPGRVVAPNLTPDRETGLGAWTDGEIVRALREGISRDGRPLFPYMPYDLYAKALSDADALAVVAYLRTLKPIKNELPKTSLDFPLPLIVRTMPEPLATPAPAVPTELVARGQTLLKLCACGACHDTNDSTHSAIPGMELAGGEPFNLPSGTVHAPNITSDPETGIGKFTDEQIIAAIDSGRSLRRPNSLIWGMPWALYAGMTADDKRAIVAALRASKPVKHVVPVDPEPRMK
ncbi:MAG: cytochrome c [Polyangiaceae bacterium]|nr:cytochrome c [Polyangiaceae bacterium]